MVMIPFSIDEQQAPPASPCVSVHHPNRFLALPRSEFHRAVAELHDVIVTSTVRFWSSRGLRYALFPITTNAVSSPMGLGSDSSPVLARVGGVDTFLADSMQFFLEYSCRFGGPGAYYVMPSFRGEPTDARHLSQFMHSEVELVGDLADLIDTAEAYLAELAAAIVERFSERQQLFPAGLGHVVELAERRPFTRLTFADAAELLHDVPSAIRLVADGARSLTPVGERILIERLGGFVWVTHWDHLAVPFYQRIHEDAGRLLAANADLIAASGEVLGAGERHSTGDQVRAALALHMVEPEPYEWYASLKDEYPISTAGFGLGVERFLMWVLNHDDIRDLQLVLRDNHVGHVP